MFTRLIVFIATMTALTAVAHEETHESSVDLSLINAVSYDLSKPIFSVKPTIGRGLRDMQSSSGGSACTSCAH